MDIPIRKNLLTSQEENRQWAAPTAALRNLSQPLRRGLTLSRQPVSNGTFWSLVVSAQHRSFLLFSQDYPEVEALLTQSSSCLFLSQCQTCITVRRCFLPTPAPPLPLSFTGFTPSKSLALVTLPWHLLPEGLN